jgi:hypothetical protein
VLLQNGCKVTTAGFKPAATTGGLERRIAMGWEISGYQSGNTSTLCSVSKSSRYALSRRNIQPGCPRYTYDFRTLCRLCAISGHQTESSQFRQKKTAAQSPPSSYFTVEQIRSG